MGGAAFLLGASFCVCSSRLTGAAPFGSAEGAGTGCAGTGCAGTGCAGMGCAGAGCAGAGFAAGGCEGIGQGALAGAEGFGTGALFSTALALATSILMGIPVLRAAGMVSLRWVGRAFLSTWSPSPGVLGVLTTSNEWVEVPRTGVAFLGNQHMFYSIHHLQNKCCLHIKDIKTRGGLHTLKR